MNDKEVMRALLYSSGNEKKTFDDLNAKDVGFLAVRQLGEVLSNSDIKSVVFNQEVISFPEFGVESYPTGRYNILKFNELNNDSLCKIAQIIQGVDYYHAGYVSANGLDQDGRLVGSLDRSRGDNVTYYLTCSRPNRDGEVRPLASMRVVSIPKGGKIYELPAFINSRGCLYEEDLKNLEDTIAKFGNESVVEISALSKTDDALPFAPFELIRKRVSEAIESGSPEKWFMTLASPAYDIISATFGEKAIKRIGENVMSFDSSLMASSDLYLVPSMVEPKQCIKHVLEGAYEKMLTDDIVGAKKILFGFDYIRTGVSKDFLEKILGDDGELIWKKIKATLL